MRSEVILLMEVGQQIQRINKDCERRYGMSVVQLVVMQFLVDRPATSAHALASAVGVHPSTLTQTLRRLCRKQFVFVGDDPRDLRRKMISVTKKGMEALEKSGAQMAADLSYVQAVEHELKIVRDRFSTPVIKDSTVSPLPSGSL